MRIRSIRPEFWTSEDVAAMNWHTRLVYIGLWSYVDDNGVGRDKERLITTALFPLDDDLSESSVRVHGALMHLETAGQITRYSVDGKPYLHITAWDTHQKINRPTGGRYPLPTCGNAVTHGALSEPSVSPPANAPLGEGEKGRRGEGEKTSSSSAEAEREFEIWWSHYPRKVGRGAAFKSYKSALKKATTQELAAGLKRALPGWQGKAPEFIPHASTWLNAERWTDEPDPGNVRYLPGGEIDPASIPADPNDWMRMRPGR